MTGPTRKNNRQPPWEGPDSEGLSFGTWLRQQREVRQIGLREVAESSKISLRYLQAFEEDQFDLLPAKVFAQGFLRQYSAYVGLDPDEVINHYLWARQALEPEDGETEEPAVRRRRRKKASPKGNGRNLWPLVLAVLGLALAVAGAFWYASGRDEAQETAETTVPFVPPPPPKEILEIPPEPPQPEIEEPRAPLAVSVEFTRDCWIEVVVDGGRERINKTYVPGETLQIDAQERVVFRKLGNAGGVTIEVNGHPFPIDAREGLVLNNLVIDLAAVERLAAGSP
ncbi:MAG: helix-turn-helix domain-containing protein [Acidobacteria bacterium]|nr:helix-turn-helix domain-containing protein [Acidobacteriota bacterium]